MNSVDVVTFYEISYIHEYEKLSRDLGRLGKKENLTGTIFSTPQGINGTLAGTKEGLIEVINLLKHSYNLQEFKPTWSKSVNNPFKRFKVKLKDRLLPLEGEFDPVVERGEHINPKDWNKIIADKDTIVLDVRNQYETEIGSFKDSLIPQMDHFINFPDFVDSNLNPKENKKIAMFCTGGIRCEKSTAYLKSEGFKNVYHLQGGILKYLEEVQEDKSLWVGECFVFDDRVAVKHNLELGKYDQCHACRFPITDEDKAHPHFEKGSSCPRCYGSKNASQISRYREREKQVQLAKTRGESHIGDEAHKIISNKIKKR